MTNTPLSIIVEVENITNKNKAIRIELSDIKKTIESGQMIVVNTDIEASMGVIRIQITDEGVVIWGGSMHHIKSRKTLGRHVAGNMVQTSGRFAGQPSVFALEIQRLEAAGYQRIGDYYVHSDKVAGYVKP